MGYIPGGRIFATSIPVRNLPMIRSLAALLDDGRIQSFEFDDADGIAIPIVLRDQIQLQIDAGSVLTSFRVRPDAGAGRIAAIAGPTSGAFFTAYEFDLTGAKQSSITVGQVAGASIDRTDSGQSWVSTNKGVFMWIVDNDYCAISPQDASAATGMICQSSFRSPYFLYGNAEGNLVIHDTRQGELYSMKPRRFGVSSFGDNGENLDLAVFAVHETGNSVAVLWSSKGPIDGDPENFVSRIAVCTKASLIRAAKLGERVETTIAMANKQLLGLSSNDVSLELIATGQPRGIFLRFVFNILTNRWEETHTIDVDDLLAELDPVLHTHRLRFVQSIES